ncbi:MAG: TrkA C-terminal domain-containing protein, partial [Limisphaerales bacterium]
RRQVLRPLLQTVFKTTTVVLLGAWLLFLLPFGISLLWALAVVVGLLILLGVLFWRRLVLLHSKLEIEIRQQIQSAATAGGTSGLAPAFFHKPLQWDLQVDEVTLTPQTDHAGKRIKDLALRTRFGCSIVGIDRQGFLLANPSADEALFPGDKLLLLGSEMQLGQAEEFLRSASTGTTLEIFEDLTTETIAVPAESPQTGKTLVELDLIRRFGVQICGIQRGDKRILVPAGVEHILSGDSLLVLGSHDKIQECRDFFSA